MHVRKAAERDLPEVRRIQRETPEAAQWDISDYPLLVAELNGQITGFLVWRTTAPDEVEILNLAVASDFRRQGAARALIQGLRAVDVFLEVRESNAGARAFYKQAGFMEAGIRFGYYSHPVESAIVMRLQS